MNIPTKFGSKWFCGFKEDCKNFMDSNDRRQMSSDDNTSHDPLGEVSLNKISFHAQVSLYTMEGKTFF